MANKKKRRRQRQRAAAKRAEEMVDVVSPKWNNFLVSGWMRSRGGPVRVLEVKEYDEEKLLPFICELFGVDSVDEFDVLDVHHLRDGGGIRVVHELADWPVGVGTAREKGTYMRGVADKPLFLKSNRPAGTTPITGKKPDLKLVPKQETVVVPPTVSFTRLPFKRYVIKELKVAS